MAKKIKFSAISIEVVLYSELDEKHVTLHYYPEKPSSSRLYLQEKSSGFSLEELQRIGEFLSLVSIVANKITAIVDGLFEA